MAYITLSTGLEIESWHIKFEFISIDMCNKRITLGVRLVKFGVNSLIGYINPDLIDATLSDFISYRNEFKHEITQMVDENSHLLLDC